MTTNNKLLFLVIVLAMLLAQACVPKEQVVFKSVKNIVVDGGLGNEPILKGEAVFYNPNKIQTRLKGIKVDVLVDGKQAAEVDQTMDLVVPRQADFTVPVEAKLSLKEIGLLDAVIGFLGGKTYQVQFVGHVRVAVHGVTVKVPVKYNEELKLR